MTTPTPGEPLPPALVDLLAGRPATPVWRNHLGGWTVRLADRFLKWNPPDAPDLRIEVDRLRWAAPYLRVPTVLRTGTGPTGSWTETVPLPGRPGSDPHWRTAPAFAAHALGRALRVLHDTLPVRNCPYRWDIDTRLQEKRSRTGVLVAVTEPRPTEDDPVVCCGDPCAPNLLLHDDGTPSGWLDLGRLGVADRWADLAVGSLSIDWNLGAGHQDEFFAGYRITRDEPRIAFYRTLWEID
jgi:kanamycin kinase